jgi:hypothetical protein
LLPGVTFGISRKAKELVWSSDVLAVGMLIAGVNEKKGAARRVGLPNVDDIEKLAALSLSICDT